MKYSNNQSFDAGNTRTQVGDGVGDSAFADENALVKDGDREFADGKQTQTTIPFNDIFPTQNCRRCGGSGHYSYNPKDGTVCYGCGGRKVVTARKFAKLANDFSNAMLRQKEPTASQIEAGDFILHPKRRPESNPFPTARLYVRVSSIELIAGTETKNCGYSTIGGGAKHFTGWIQVIFEGADEVFKFSENEILKRKYTLDDAFRYCEPKTVKFVKARIAEIKTEGSVMPEQTK